MANHNADQTLETLGYKPQFRRVLSRADLLIYGLAFVTPTAPYPLYGILLRDTNGHVALAYLVAMVAMLFTAMSYGRMSGAFPVAGSTYTFTQRAINPYIGFMAGWAMIMDYFLIPLLSVSYAALTINRWVPQVPYMGWVILFTALITSINVRGIQVTARANRIMLFVMIFATGLFIWLASRWVIGENGVSGLISPQTIYNPSTFSISPLMVGAAIATLSYIGFDGISTLAEDTKNPEKDISFATVGTCLLQGGFCFVQVYLAQLVWSNYRNFPDIETAIQDVGQRIGGIWMLGWIFIILLVAGLASAMAGQAGASRLLFGMGRDRLIPYRIFGYVHPKYATPIYSIFVMAFVTMVGANWIDFELCVHLVNFGAFVGFILVNLCVIAHYYVRLKQR